MLVTRVITLVLLAGIAVHRYVTIRKPAGVDEYHALVRQAAERIPKRIGSWIGEDVPVPPRAIKVLDPNAIISRRYVNVETGVSAGVLFVHCADAHDMVGHFPLRCYPAQGWNVRAAAERDWDADGLMLTGMEYEFTMAGVDGGHAEHAVAVANTLLRPGGPLREMTALSRTIVGAGGQALGAGQVQVSLDAALSEPDRRRAVTELMTGFAPAIDAVLSGHR